MIGELEINYYNIIQLVGFCLQTSVVYLLYHNKIISLCTVEVISLPYFILQKETAFETCLSNLLIYDGEPFGP